MAGSVATRPAVLIRPWHTPMTGRDPAEAHRASTPLELLFDLCFVVAVSQAAGSLHHDLAAGRIGHGLVNYLVVFFAIWWPWMNFTWFASAYDTDDVQYRLLTFVQIAGVLVVAAGVPAAFERQDFTVMVIGYVIMRIALVAQWLRAAREDPVGRPVALRFATAIALIQVAWVVRLLVGWSEVGYLTFLVLGILELAVPAWAERAGRHTPWHGGHIVERYGLFTIIVLGECVLATMTATQAAFAAGGLLLPLLTVAIGGLLLVFAMWWSYFKHEPDVGHHRSLRSMIGWGYGHYFVFAAAAALGRRAGGRRGHDRRRGRPRPGRRRGDRGGAGRDLPRRGRRPPCPGHAAGPGPAGGLPRPDPGDRARGARDRGPDGGRRHGPARVRFGRPECRADRAPDRPEGYR